MNKHVEDVRKDLDANYEEETKNGRTEYECVITLRGRSALDCYCCGVDDLKYLINEGQFVAQSKDIKSIKFYPVKKSKNTQPKVAGKGAFDGVF